MAPGADRISRVRSALVAGWRGFFRGFTRSRRARRPDPPTDLYRTALALTLLNFVAFAVVTSFFGGDALNGKIVAGQYFVGSKGTFTAVDRGYWIYSLIHAVVSLLSLVAVMVWGFVGLLTGRIDFFPGDDDRSHRGRGTI